MSWCVRWLFVRCCFPNITVNSPPDAAWKCMQLCYYHNELKQVVQLTPRQVLGVNCTTCLNSTIDTGIVHFIFTQCVCVWFLDIMHVRQEHSERWRGDDVSGCVCRCIPRHTLNILVSNFQFAVYFNFLFPFQCQCLADCANLFQMAPAARLPGKNSKRMECAANKVGLARLWFSVLVNHSVPVYAALNLPPLILHPVHKHTHTHNSGQDFWKLVSHRLSISPFPHPPLPIAKCVFTFSPWGCSLISFKICSTNHS